MADVAEPQSDDGHAEITLRGPAILLLGPVAIAHSDDRLSTAQRRILARLALARPGAVDLDQISEAVWGDDPPATARTAVHNQISRLRTRLGADSIATVDGSYLLTLSTDLDEVPLELDAAERELTNGDPASAFESAATALQRWRGIPLEELAELPEAQSARRRLAEIHHSLENIRLAAGIEVGRTGWAVPEAERLVGGAPHDEQRWALLMKALDIAGRRGDALGAYDRARRWLGDELGLEPGPMLRAAEVAVLSPGSAQLPHGPVRLIGRADLIDEALRRLGAGENVVLTGEAGIGKTRVLDDLVGRLRRSGRTVARSRCVEHPDTAITTLTDLAGELGLTLDQSIPPVTAFAEAIAHRCSLGSNVVLVVDDIERAGPTSETALAAAAARTGVTLLASAGGDAALPGDMDISTIDVGPLDERDIDELAGELLGHALGPGDPAPAWLAAMSGGNPLLLECLLDDGAWLTAAPTHPATSAEGLPPLRALRDLVRQRVDRLGTTARTALEIAAVCGRRSPLTLLEALGPAEGIDGAVAASLLFEESDEDGRVWVRFRHGAVRRTIYDDLPPGRRMEIHHRAATLLAAEGAPAPSVAAHALAATEVDPITAAVRAAAAAREATNEGAHADAAQWYERSTVAAASATDGERHRVVALVGRGDSLRLAGAPDQELALFEAADAAVALGEPDLIGDAAFSVLQLGATTESGSLHQRAIELSELALELVVDSEQRALISGAASLTHSMTGHPDLCRELFVQAEAAASTEATRRHILPFAYLALGHPADLGRREAITAELLEIATRVDDPVATFEGWHLAFSVALQRGDGAAAREAVEEMDQLVARVGDVGRQWSMAYQRAAVAHLDGEPDLAERYSEEALGIFSGVSPSRAFATYGGQLLAIRMTRGRVDELADSLHGLVTDQPGVPAWNAAYALSLAASDPDAAARYAATALDDAANDFTWLAGHVVGGRAAALVGDEELRRRYAERLLPWSGLVCWQGTCAYGPVDTVLAMLSEASGDHDGAVRFARSARALANELGAPEYARELDRWS